MSSDDQAAVLGIRGGGSYYSFATQDHSYDSAPDLSFRQGVFKAGFAGWDIGFVLELGDFGLLELPDEGNPAPHRLTAEARAAWSVLWGDITMEDAAHESEFRARTEHLRGSVAPSQTPSTFLVRMFSPRDHDHLVGFRTLEIDEEGCTLARRILRTWPVELPSRGR